MKGKLFPVLTLIWALLLPQSVLAWDNTGHELVARIAWDNMNATARQNAIALLNEAPKDACLLDLFPKDSRPLEERQREFFMRVSTWPDIVRPQDKGSVKDTRPCTRFHQRDWHFINLFWEGTSGDPQDPPHDRTDIAVPEVNAVERLTLFRTFVACGAPPCSKPEDERATTLAWILHLVGDIHQPLHTSARVTKSTPQGDRGGNLFKLDPNDVSPDLHTYWDHIVDRSISRQKSESDQAYLARVAATIVAEHPRSQMSSRLKPGDFDAWAREGFETTKQEVYPKSLQEGQVPSTDYQANAFRISKEAIALGGYRLADLLNQLFGPKQH